MIPNRATWRRVSSSYLVLVLFLFCGRIEAQTANLAEMPKPAAVSSWLKGSDALDVAARRSGAFHILREIIKDLAGPRLFSGAWTPQESELLLAYQSAQSAAATEGLALIKSRGAPAAGFDSPGPTWTRLKMKYENDAALEEDILEAFFSPAFRQAYADQQKSLASSGARQRERSGDGSPPSGDLFDRLKRAAPDASYAPAQVWSTLPENPLLLLASGLMLLAYPVVGWITSRRVRFWIQRGTVINSRVTETETTHTTAGTRDASGFQTPGTTTTTKSRSEEFYLQNAREKFSVVVRQVVFPARPQELMSAVYGSGALCHLYNHSTGRWQDLQRGYSSARVSSFVTASWLSMLLCAAVAALTFLLGHWTEASALPLVASFITFGFGFWFCGGFLMRFYHIVGDRRLRAAARQLPLSAAQR